MLEMIAKTLKVLNSETEPGQISLAFCLAMVMAFTPLFSPHNLIVLLLVLILRVNLSTFGVSWAALSTAAFGLDPLFHAVGLSLLKAKALEGIWTILYNTTWFRMDHLNNTIVMGSLCIALVLFIPVYFILNWLIRRYREHILEWVNKTPIMRTLKASKLYEFYQTAKGFGGAS